MNRQTTISTLIVLIFLALASCKNVSKKISTLETRNPICTCYQQFVDAVYSQNTNFESPTIEADLKQIYENLILENTEFVKCTDDTVFNGDLFSKSKLRIYSSMDPNCADLTKLQAIIDHGPYIYKTY